MDEQKTIDLDSYRARIEQRRKARTRTAALIAGGVLLLVAAAVVVYLITRSDTSDRIILPYIAHQRPAVDPHLPSANALADKLDEVVFDGLFNISANPSGVIYEDGLGEYLGIDASNVVTVRLKTNKRWHSSFRAAVEDDDVTITPAAAVMFTARDLDFTLRRIQALGTLSPDWILVSQALDPIGFEGPDQDNVIRFQFRPDRIWKEADIKEVLSFKILPDKSPMNALTYANGTAAYLALPAQQGVSNYYRVPGSQATISQVVLSPFVDNSTYATELRNTTINVLLETPFGSLSPILEEPEDYFTKSNISTTFFAVLFNTERLSREQRIELRRLLNSRVITDRFFKVGTPQQRHIVDYKGNRDNYRDYVNASVFPSTSYYIDEDVIAPIADDTPPNLSLLPDTVQIRASMNFGFREEYADLLAILNDPAVTRGKVRALAVQNTEIARGAYDAVLVHFTGYRSNFLFDLYDIFLREPNLEAYKITLLTGTDETGAQGVLPASLTGGRNFFRLDAATANPEGQDALALLTNVYGFMSTRFIGDKQEYARRVNELEHTMALGAWLFSLPSLAYFTTQFDSTSINLYGVASQLSTIEKWRENPDY